MPSQLSPAHRDMLDRIYRSWVADGQWPVFAEIDKALDRAGNDALELLRELFPIPHPVRARGNAPYERH